MGVPAVRSYRAGACPGSRCRGVRHKSGRLGRGAIRLCEPVCGRIRLLQQMGAVAAALLDWRRPVLFPLLDAGERALAIFGRPGCAISAGRWTASRHRASGTRPPPRSSRTKLVGKRRRGCSRWKPGIAAVRSAGRGQDDVAAPVGLRTGRRSTVLRLFSFWRRPSVGHQPLRRARRRPTSHRFLDPHVQPDHRVRQEPSAARRG